MIRLSTLIKEVALKPYKKMIIGSVVAFMKDKYKLNANITLKRKSNPALIGDVPMNHNSVNKNKFTVHWNPNYSTEYLIKILIHELTHVKQISKKELQPAPDYKSIYWKGKEFITVRDYNKLIKKDRNSNRKLPWEIEADTNMKKLYSEFLNSSYWKGMYGKDVTLDYLIDNLS